MVTAGIGTAESPIVGSFQEPFSNCRGNYFKHYIEKRGDQQWIHHIIGGKIHTYDNDMGAKDISKWRGQSEV
jgi:hypothetical protein